MIMKYKKIKLKNNKSVLVDESAKGKTGYCFNISLSKIDKLSRDYEIGTFEEMYTHKIIATINHSISLDVPMIVMEDEVEKLLTPFILDNGDLYCHNTPFLVKKLKEVQQKGVYSEDDLRKAFIAGDCYGQQVSTKGNIDEYVQSLKQEYIELEMEAECCKKYTSCNTNCRYDNETVWKIKTNRVDGQLMAYVK